MASKTPSEVATFIRSLEDAAAEHPTRTIGWLLHSAMNIARGQTQSNPGFASNSELIEGLKALIPADWEREKDAQKK